MTVFCLKLLCLTLKRGSVVGVLIILLGIGYDCSGGGILLALVVAEAQFQGIFRFSLSTEMTYLLKLLLTLFSLSIFCV